MNRRKFFAGLALAPALPVAAVAATGSSEPAEVIYEIKGDELVRMAMEAGRTVAGELLDDIARGEITLNQARAHLHALYA